MPLINIPTIGCGYKEQYIKIAIFGIDTNVGKDNKEALSRFSRLKDDYDNNKNWEDIYDRLVKPFINMAFVEYANESIFYEFVLKFLAEFYKKELGFGWQGWEELKNNKEKYSGILQSFILGNIHSFEIDKDICENGFKIKKSKSYNANEKDWAEVKKASKRFLDKKLKDIINICEPKLLLILNWDSFNCKKWLDDNHYKRKDEICDFDNHFYYAHIETPNTHIYKIVHPSSMVKKKIKFIEQISLIIEHFSNREDTD